jgi:hypothetical protein
MTGREHGRGRKIYDLVGDDNAPLDCQSGVADRGEEGYHRLAPMIDDEGLGEQI